MKKILNPTEKSRTQNNLIPRPTLSSPQKTIVLFIFLSGLGLTMLFFFTNSSLNKIDSDSDSISYSTLLTSLSTGGYSQFHSDKKLLRSKIATILSSPQNEKEETYATNIALYLFPDLLPDSNLDRDYRFMRARR